MRYLTAIATPAIQSLVEGNIGAKRLRPLRPNEPADQLGVERFAGVLADRSASIVAVSRGVPVVLIGGLDRTTLQRFREVAAAGIDVRLCRSDLHLSEPTLHALSALRAPSPAGVIIASIHGCASGPAADIMTAAALLGDGRRSADEMAAVLSTSTAGLRSALKEAGLIGISGLLSHMRCLHALWALESGKANFWSAAGFHTLAQVSEFFSRMTGAPIGRWRVPGGFNALLRALPAAIAPANGLAAEEA